MTPNKWVTIGLPVALAVLLPLALLFGHFENHSFCDKCGAESDASDWQIPFTHVTLFSHSNFSETTLSRVLRANDIVPKHQHNWIFAGGAGNGILASGRGRRLYAAANSEEFAALVLLLHENQQTEFRDRVLAGALDPYRSHLFLRVIDRTPAEAMSAEELQDWVEEQSDYLDERLVAEGY